MKDGNLPQSRTSPHKPFVQWQKSSMTKYRELISKSSGAALLLTILVENMNDSNAVVVSQQTLSQIMGCQPRSIRRYVQILEEGEWINILKIATANVYHVNDAYFWQRSRKIKPHLAKINASVILSEAEQTQSIDELMRGRKVNRIPKTNEVDSLVILGDEDPPTQDEMEYIK